MEPGDCETLAKLLIDEFRSIGRIWSAAPEALRRVLGNQSPVVSLIISSRDASIETIAGELRGMRIDPFDPALRRYLIASMGSLSDEMLRVLFLDKGRQLISDEQLQHGTLSHLAVYPRTIFRRALELNAAGIILVHNHPSGDPSPSPQDVEATRQLDRIGRSLDVEVVDHIIVTSAYVHHIMNKDAMCGKVPASSFVTFCAPPPRDRRADARAALANAEIANHRRILRQQLIGAPELFGDPAWEMLVDLFIHECKGKDLSISSLCVAPNIPMSSALRLVQKLCDAGIVRRVPDPFDGRRSIIKLEPEISHRLRAYFEAGSE
ncbi:JAB domain-containing protein [Sphingopyxis sp.]|uniref:JAB domain-containing protein n=1 Tax=Sphingopyxis sp. TaxID=1908224 RepID=UPI003BAD662B